ncbi:MAG: PilT/PilU family type 4a pilus ATPase [Acidobacteriota bacterium]|nr:PilT/PilU family type 4a pilus ATPase [Acidobacteriota bacterium]MDH3783966.1 PilT/PilU family type 4a pilus ATPase [Acidobacteriota bacterium]
MQLDLLDIDDLLRFMVEKQASDLHLKPARPPLLRLNGKLLPLKTDPVPPDAIPTMLDKILTDRQRAALKDMQAVDFGYSVPGVSRFRASVFHQRGTLSAIFRRVPFDFPSLEDWSLPPVVEEFTKLPQGLVLITGPTGAGKSSTLAAMMRRVADTRLVHIVTVEDPIEFLLNDNLGAVTQREIGCDTPGFSHALRNALRQDPDVIMVGEMRDAETMSTVLTAAETGHLVFSTLHTNGAVQTIDRLIDSFPSGNHRQIRQQLANVLQAVVSMKLIERKDGQGLVAAIEILRRSPRVSKLILEGNLEALEEELESSVSYYRMQSMNQSTAALVLNGAVSVETALASSSNPGDLDLILRKFLYQSENPVDGGDDMGQPLGDFSKILELQEIRQRYEESQERHKTDLDAKDEEIQRLQQALAQNSEHVDSNDGAVERLRDENSRLAQQMKLVRTEYETKIERLNDRIRDLSGTTATGGEPSSKTAEPVGAEPKRGFFRR